MKKLASLILLLLASASFSFSQPYVVNVGLVNASPNDTVLVPVNVTGFNNIGAIGFYIGYDHTVLTPAVKPVINIHSGLSGIMFNDDGQFLRVAWAATSEGINFGSTKLFDMKFKLKSKMTQLCFDLANSSVADYTSMEYVDVTWNCGKVDDITQGLNNSNFDNSTSVYPNPSDGLFNLKLNKGEKDISVYSLDGKQILSRKLNSDKPNTYFFDLSSFSKGIYILKLTSEENISYKKLIIQ